MGNFSERHHTVDSYEKMLATFSPTDAGIALRLFMDPVYSSLLGSWTGRQQWARLLDILEPKLTSTTDRALMAAVRALPGNPDQHREGSGSAGGDGAGLWLRAFTGSAVAIVEAFTALVVPDAPDAAAV